MATGAWEKGDKRSVFRGELAFCGVQSFWVGTDIKERMSDEMGVDAVAAQYKGLRSSPVAGQVDILLAPNIETADGVYRAMACYGQARLGGVLIGAGVPVALCMPSDSIDTAFNSIALAVLAA